MLLQLIYTGHLFYIDGNVIEDKENRMKNKMSEHCKQMYWVHLLKEKSPRNFKYLLALRTWISNLIVSVVKMVENEKENF